jgi:hypothetical protein
MSLTKAVQNRSISFGTGAYSFAETGQQVESDSVRVWEITLDALPAGNSGQISTDGSDRKVTLSTGHNITDADVVDVYWSGGFRYGCTAAVATNVATVSGGSGDTLPVDTTVCTLCTQVETADLALTGDNVEWLAIVYVNFDTPTAKASIDLHDAGGSEKQEDLVHSAALGGCANVYNVDGGDTNPIAGDSIIEGHSSHNAATAGMIYVLALVDAT